MFKHSRPLFSSQTADILRRKCFVHRPLDVTPGCLLQPGEDAFDSPARRNCYPEISVRDRDAGRPQPLQRPSSFCLVLPRGCWLETLAAATELGQTRQICHTALCVHPATRRQRLRLPGAASNFQNATRKISLVKRCEAARQAKGARLVRINVINGQNRAHKPLDD
jgi:hypothetical protein